MYLVLSDICRVWPTDFLILFISTSPILLRMLTWGALFALKI